MGGWRQFCVNQGHKKMEQIQEYWNILILLKPSAEK